MLQSVELPIAHRCAGLRREHKAARGGEVIGFGERPDLADDGGRRPVFRVDPTDGQVTRVTGDDGAYTDLNPAPDGRYLYALRSAVDSPPTPVRIDLNPDTGAAGPAARPRAKLVTKFL